MLLRPALVYLSWIPCKETLNDERSVAEEGRTILKVGHHPIGLAPALNKKGRNGASR